MNPAHNIPSYDSMIHFNIILPPTIFICFYHQNPIRISFAPHLWEMPCPSHHPGLLYWAVSVSNEALHYAVFSTVLLFRPSSVRNRCSSEFIRSRYRAGWTLWSSCCLTTMFQLQSSECAGLVTSQFVSYFRVLFSVLLRETTGSLNATWPKFELCTSEQKSGALPQHHPAR
jgi:hypothetical protein